MDGNVAIIVFLAVVILVVVLVIIVVHNTQIASWWRSRRMCVFRLGGVTTLKRTLNYTCAMCHDRMEAGDKVRTLSCDHVFHCGDSSQCPCGIDYWLLNTQVMSCPICRQIPQPVLPWKRPPPSSPAASASPSSSSSSQEQLLRTSTSDSEEEPLIPTPDNPASPSP